MTESDEEQICPDCGEPLHHNWFGYLACFCRWGGRPPTALEVITAADDAEAASHRN